MMDPFPSAAPWWVKTVWLVGQVSRPLSMIILAISCAATGIIVALKADNGIDGAAVIAALGVIAGGMYGFKVLENNKAKSVEGDVAKAQGVPLVDSPPSQG